MDLNATAATLGPVVLLDPTQGPDERRVAMAPRVHGSLEGLVIGFLDNGKPNAGAFLRIVERELHRRWSLGDSVHGRKADGSRIAPGELLDSMAARCHAIVVGVGD